MSDQTYNVKYNIEVESTDAVQQLTSFTTAVENLAGFNADMSSAVAKINSAFQALDKAFKADKNGKKRDYNYTFKIDTRSGQGKLDRILRTIESIEAKAKGIRLVVNPGKAFNSKGVEANAKQIIEHSRAVFGNIAGTTHTTQTTLTRSIGKINSALTHLERGREINIKTEAAKRRLKDILELLGQVRTATGQAINLGAVVSKNQTKAFRATPEPTFLLPSNVQTRLAQAGLLPHTLASAPKAADTNKVIAAQQKQLQLQNAAIVKGLIRSNNQTFATYNSRQKAAINRLQYSRPPSLRNALPFAYMLNGYMLYSGMKSQLSNAVEYANIMESAHSILKVADRDMGSFERRFDTMAHNVRTVGIETKFTAVQVAGAVKYLAMAGQHIDTINKSIRPITNLALIGDNDIAQIADLTTNIMAGYDISPDSMPAVADIIASTVSRSNVNIIEVAESYKMAAGYMRMAGIDFSESAAAIGLLGNVGVKGTMAGTSLRSIATRLAYQPKEAREILDKLGVRFTHFVDVYGRQIERIRPLADIFEDLKKKGATLGDMSKIFGRWGANAGMALMLNADKLRTLTEQNRSSHGIATTLAQVKQQTTKGLWYQMTSMLSESFMKGYQTLEPKLQMVLKKFTANFNMDRFAEGLTTVATALLDIFALLGKIATWFVNNFKWIEPLLFTGFVATRLFKLAGAVTNLAIAMGFLGKQSAAATGLQVLSALTGSAIGMRGLSGALSFGAKRNLVTTLRSVGVSGGKGTLTAALAGAGIGKGVSLLGRRAASGVFATQVATGKGVVGAGAAIAGIGTGAVAAVAAVSTLVGLLGYVAYKTWKIKEAKDAVMADLQKKEVYVYPAFDALNKKLEDTYTKAIAAKGAINNLTREGKLKDLTGQAPGMFTGNWWKGLGGTILWALSSRYGYADISKYYTTAHAYQEDLKNSIETLARFDGVETFAAAYGELGKLKSVEEVNAFIENIPQLYGLRGDIDKSLYSVYSDMSNIRLFKTGLKNMTVEQATNTDEYHNYNNQVTVPKIAKIVRGYRDAISSQENALAHVLGGSITEEKLNELGLFKGKDGQWAMKPLAENADKTQYLTNKRQLQYILGTRVQALREAWGNDGAIVANLMEKAGFSSDLFSNEPQREDKKPWEAPGISVTGLEDDQGAGGNYSGTGKLSSAAPKQVIVNITNLLSIQTLELLRTQDGKLPEIQDLKEQMAQALIDVVHDFDASWNGA